MSYNKGVTDMPDRMLYPCDCGDPSCPVWDHKGPWYEAPLPRRWHRCWPWTQGKMRDGRVIQRCACGAIRQVPERHWAFKNDRRRTS